MNDTTTHRRYARRVHARITPALLDALERVARRHELHRSEAIRDAIRRYVARLEYADRRADGRAR